MTDKWSERPLVPPPPDVSRRLRIGDMTSPGGGAAAPAAAAPSDPAALLAALMSTDNNVRSQAEVSVHGIPYIPPTSGIPFSSSATFLESIDARGQLRLLSRYINKN